MQANPKTTIDFSALEHQVEAAVFNLPELPNNLTGKGILIGAGGFLHFTNAWVLIRMLRRHGCNLSIQMWHLGDSEVSPAMRELLGPYGVECVDALGVARRAGVKPPTGRQIKSFGIVYSPFKEVLVLDANNFPVRDPEYLFADPQYRISGAVLWPALNYAGPAPRYCKALGIPLRPEQEIDDGQILVDKEQCWESLAFASWLQTQQDISDVLRQKGVGFRFAWHKFGLTIVTPGSPEFLPSGPGCCVGGIICQQDFQDERIFQHRTGYHWHLFGENPWIPGALLEPESREFLAELREKWNGRVAAIRPSGLVPDPVRNELIDSMWISDTAASEGWFSFTHAKPHEDGFRITKQPEEDEKVTDWIKVLERNRQKERPWQGICFNRNGTMGEYSGKLVFWDLTVEEGLPVLTLYGAPGVSDARLTFRRLSRGVWEGGLGAPNGGRQFVLRAVQNPNLVPEVAGDYSELTQILHAQFGSTLGLVNSSPLLADHIVGVYAAAAAANAGLTITYYTPYAEWLNRIENARLTISSVLPDTVDLAATGNIVDLNHGYWQQIRYGRSRAAWYSSNISPTLQPRRPEKVDRTIQVKRFDFARYIVVAPGSSPTQRWPSSHWQRFAYLARNSGFEVVALGARHNEEQVLELCDSGIFGVVDDRADWVTDVLLGAEAIVATDDGIAHLGGLFDIPTIALHAQLPSKFLWSFTNVKSATPNSECTFCRWATDRGYHAVCESGCSALASVSPEHLMKLLRTMITEEALPSRS